MFKRLFELEISKIFQKILYSYKGFLFNICLITADWCPALGLCALYHVYYSVVGILELTEKCFLPINRLLLLSGGNCSNEK